MNDVVISYNERDLFYYFQKVRLLKAKELNDANIERTKDQKEEKPTFKGVMKNVGHFFERGTKNYKELDALLTKSLKEFEEKHTLVIDAEKAEELINTLFKDDLYGLTKLVFASTIILDDEYDYPHEDEGLKEVSFILYGNKTTINEIRKKLNDNYNAISPNSLSNVQKGVLLGVAVTSVVGVVSMPLILGAGVGATAAAGAALAAKGFTDVGILTAEAVVLGAAFTGLAYGGMKLYNDIKIKEEFKKLSPEKNALYLAIQCTFIQRCKENLSEDEFKEQLDIILKNLNILKADLDYYLFVEKESTKENKAKIKSFHDFDNRLVKVLGI